MEKSNVRTVSDYGSFEEILSQSEPQARVLAHRLRALLAEVMPGIVEVPWPKQRVAGYGVGPRKMTEHFCHISAHKRHINLGFNYGAELPDPENLLEGTGKLFRHVKITSPEDLERPALRHLLEHASLHRMPEKPGG